MPKSEKQRKKRAAKKKSVAVGQQVRRGRKERLSAKLHRVEHLFPDPDNRETLLIDGEEHYIEGEIDSYVVVSVPETTTEGAANIVKAKIQAATNRPVLVVTHNIEFMRLRELDHKETALRIKEAEDAAIKHEEALVAVHGDRSGVGDDGGVDSGTEGQPSDSSEGVAAPTDEADPEEEADEAQTEGVGG